MDLGFAYMEQGHPPFLAMGPASARPTVSAMIGYVGAGVYEETLFRLMLVPLFFAILRLLQMPQVLASSWAVTASALLFALAHHAGSPGEAFTWYAFVFRWMAGVFFAWVFVIRGFGIAVGTHTAYDFLVGWIRLACRLAGGSPCNPPRPRVDARHSYREADRAHRPPLGHPLLAVRVQPAAADGQAAAWDGLPAGGPGRPFPPGGRPPAGRAGPRPRARPHPDHGRPDDHGPAGRVPRRAGAWRTGWTIRAA